MTSKKVDIPQYVKIIMGVAAVFMPLFLILPLFLWGNNSPKTDPNLLVLQAERLAPIGKVHAKTAAELKAEAEAKAIADAEAAAKAAARPKVDYKLTDVAAAEGHFNSVCSACHGIGLMGAPKPDDKAAWEKRIADHGGISALIESGLNGVNAMPARGGSSMSDDEFGQTVLFMLSKSGL